MSQNRLSADLCELRHTAALSAAHMHHESEEIRGLCQLHEVQHRLPYQPVVLFVEFVRTQRWPLLRAIRMRNARTDECRFHFDDFAWIVWQVVHSTPFRFSQRA